MKIAVVGDPRREEKDLPLIKEGGGIFDSCLYVPINQVRLDIEESFAVMYEDKNLIEFDYVLPIPTLPYREFFYNMVRILSESVHLPCEPEKYLLTFNEFLLFDYLRKNGIPTRDFIVTTSKTPFKEIKKDIQFPVIVQPSYKKVVVTDAHTLRDVISLSKFGSPVKLENLIKPRKNIWVFLTDNVIACYKKTKGIPKAMKSNGKLRKISLKIKKLVNCDYCALNFLEYDKKLILNKLTFSPNFSRFQEITKKNISKILLTQIYKELERKEEKKWWQKVYERFTK